MVSQRVRRSHTLIEAVVAYALFAALVLGVAPNPTPAVNGLRQGFEKQVVSGVLVGELARAEQVALAGKPLATEALDPAAWPAARQIRELKLRREVRPQRAGFAIELRASWLHKPDGSPQQATLKGWVSNPDRGSK